MANYGDCPECGSAQTWYVGDYVNSDYPGVVMEGFKCECGHKFLNDQAMLSDDTDDDDTQPAIRGVDLPTEPYGDDDDESNWLYRYGDDF